jgi:hypothetical protein
MPFISSIRGNYSAVGRGRGIGLRNLASIISGGTITNVGGYRIHTFTSNSTFTITDDGRGPVSEVEYLVVAGGGGGSGYNSGGGGGAGGYRSGTFSTVATGSYPVVVGAGGPGGPHFISGSWDGKGRNSSFNDISSAGGGRGSQGDATLAEVQGGSGGGQRDPANQIFAGNTPSVSPSQGNPGGTGVYNPPA